MSAAWMAFLARQDERTFAEVYEEGHRLVWTLCRRLLSNPEDAADATQSAWTRFLEDAAARRLSAETPLADVLARLAVREADALRKRLRRRAVREVMVEELPEPTEPVPSSQQEALAAAQLHEVLEELVEELPEAERLSIQLHFFQGLTHREIAEWLGVPRGTVGSHIHRATRRLEPAARRRGITSAAGALTMMAGTARLLTPSSADAAEVFRTAKANSAVSLTASGAAVPATLKLLLGGAAALAVVALVLIATVSGWDGEAAVSSPPVTVVAPSSNAAAPPAVELAEAEPTPAPTATPSPSPTPEVSLPLLSVVVFDEHGEPVPGAKVSRLWSDSVDLFTDEEGTVTFTGLTAGVWNISVQVDGYPEQRHATALESDSLAVLEVNLPVPLTLYGTITDAAGTPLPDVRVSASPPYTMRTSPSTPTSTQSDAEGHYVLHCSAEWVQKGYQTHYLDLSLSAGGYARKPIAVAFPYPIPKSLEFNATLDPIKEAYHLVGRVVNESGQPIAGVHLSKYADRIWDSGSNIGRTDEVGEFTFTFTPDDPRLPERFWAFHPDYSLISVPIDEEKGDDLIITLPKGQALSGRVIDTEGRPIAGAYVDASLLTHSTLSQQYAEDVMEIPMEYSFHEVQTDGAGYFYLSGLSGRLQYGVRADGYSEKEVLEFPLDGEPVEVVLEKEAKGILRGRIIDAITGAPIPGFTLNYVNCEERRAREFESPLWIGGRGPGIYFDKTDGTFEIDDLNAPSPLILTVTAAGYGTSKHFALTSPVNQPEEVMIELYPEDNPLIFRGIVVDDAGNPMEGIGVGLFNSRTLLPVKAGMTESDFSPEIILATRSEILDTINTTTDSEGRFELIPTLHAPFTMIVVMWLDNEPVTFQATLPDPHRLGAVERGSLRLVVEGE